MNEYQIRQELEECYTNYLFDDSTKNKGLYLRKLSQLNEIITPKEVSKITPKNRQTDKSINVSDIDDTPYLVDDILEGGILD